MNIKDSYRIFFAIPYKKYILKKYQNVATKIRNKYQHINTIFADTEIGPSQSLSDIASFKKQNNELPVQILNEINKADVVIADLTENNPNVFYELGVAHRSKGDVPDGLDSRSHALILGKGLHYPGRT